MDVGLNIQYCRYSMPKTGRADSVHVYASMDTVVY